MANTPEFSTCVVALNGRPYSIEYFDRKGGAGTILFVHGLGGAKENFYEACKVKSLANYRIICFDNPGTGNSTYHDDCPLNVDDLVQITRQFIDRIGLQNYFLCGTSMGGLVTMLYLKRYGPDEIKGYINIEGNFMPEDCMFSGKVVIHDFEAFRHSWAHNIEEMKKRKNAGYHIISNNLALNTNINAYYHYSFQTVGYSSNGNILALYKELKIPKLFIYGEENKTLSYIPDLQRSGENIEMIAGSNHFVFYDNPVGLYEVIANFVKRN